MNWFKFFLVIPCICGAIESAEETQWRMETKAAITYTKDADASLQDNHLKEARDLYEKALAYDTMYAPAHLGMAKTYQLQHQNAEAIREYQSAIIFDPTLVEAYNGLGKLFLSMKKFTEAKEVYFKLCASVPYRPTEEAEGKQLKRAQLSGKTVYIYADGSLEQQILFSRYLPLLKKMGADVSFKPLKGTEKVFALSFPEIKIISWLTLEEDISYQFKAPLSSLPLLFTTLPTEPYLKGDGSLFQDVISKTVPRIGIDASISPEELKKWPKASFYTLTSGQFSDPDLSELISSNDSFDDLAAAIAGLDIILCSNGPIAYLAAAMGKPTHVFFSKEIPWELLPKEGRSLFYPTMYILSLH